ncbi:MAG TPA: phytanoyl-CoA dioxygenase family protein [Planctomycetota bacterium]|nr:phytanoyl-CoA dioxygenase family protein [Planctomycetota bacterium]
MDTDELAALRDAAASGNGAPRAPSPGVPPTGAPRAAMGAAPRPDGPASDETIARLLSDPRALQMPWVESPLFESMLASSRMTDAIKAQARAFRRDGFVILENFFPRELIDAVLSRYDWLFDPATQFDATPEVSRLLKLDPNRRQDAWWVHEPVRTLAADPRLLGLLKYLYGREPIPFQTLNFLPGTQQPTHSDAIHFSCAPSGFMCGVWVALEDVTEHNGPLHYYPGSHLLPEMRLEQLGLWAGDNQEELGPNYAFFEDYVRSVIRARALERKRLVIKKGTALIWASNLLHGGCPITRPGTTRKSQVTHYYFEDCLYYTPIYSNALLGEYRLKEVVDLRTNRTVPHRVNGTALELLPLPNGNHRLLRPGARGSYVLKPGLPRGIMDLIESEVRDLRGVQGLDPLERARVMAQLCDVALRAHAAIPPAS